MANFDFSKETGDERLLLIAFNNQQPMSAAQLATVLRALDSDYKSMTGRNLVLGHMEVGSVWIWLMDAAVYGGGAIIGTAAVAKAVEELATFAKKLKEDFEKKKLPDENLLLSAPMVDRSVAAIAKVAVDTNGTFRMKHTRETNAAKDTIEIEITPAEAAEAHKRVKSRPKRGVAYESIPRLIAKPEEIKQIAHTMRELPPVTSDVEAVIRALVQAHMMLGSTYALEHVATTLEFEGRSDIAVIIRQMTGKGGTLVNVEV
ncbi:hypothetical protein GOC55_27035 [Sinorhizobium medicae]|uniref:hypothetical protein n=1 Tax=Sinorhizobium medicae TaxID=110321 RepID=UPI0003759761|nr:hypothetical protein [Sinorhizobium medicae]MDX0537067.1 hypothetical protein [Sinorhizobium medicae]UFX06556.1 hypothetical protein SmedWSM1115_33185 [Sinorhizobium medicae WSM1115]